MKGLSVKEEDNLGGEIASGVGRGQIREGFVFPGRSLNFTLS